MSVKFAVLAVLSFSGTAGARSLFDAGSQVNPIQKVVQLLSELEAKIIKEGEMEEKAYKEFFEWCDDAARNSRFAIETATKQKEKLEAAIAKATSDAEAAAESIEELSAQIATDEADLKAATAIREKELADFTASEAELMDAIDMLERAIGILEQHAASSLLQTQVDPTKLDVLLKTLSTVVDAASFSQGDKQKLLALVQSRQKSAEDADMDTMLGAPDPTVYKGHSGGIVDVLTDMKEKAEAQLSEERKAETESKHNYEVLKVALTDAIKAANSELAEAKNDKATAESDKAIAEGDLAKTVKDLALAKESMDTAGADCMTAAQEHEYSMKARAEELAVIAKAKKIIQSTTSGAEGQTYSFLQVGMGSQLRTAADLRNFEVVNAIKSLAAKMHSTQLTQLASRIAATIRYGSSNGDDPFAKVKGLIVDMIDKLMKEAEAEASFKAYCDEEMAKTEQKKSELNADLDKLNSKIDTLSARSAQLKEEVAELQKELADLADLQAEMDKTRDEEKATYATLKEDLEQGIAGVEAALKVLRDYYGESEEALLQNDAKGFNAFMQQPAAPEGHEKASGAGGGIIDFLEVILADFTKNLAEATSAEDEAQLEYDKITQENKITKATKEQDVKYKTKEFQQADVEIAELTADKTATQTELDAVMEYDAKIKDQCIAKPEPYEERKKRREAEIAGLKEALSILEGQAFLQRKSTLRGIAAHQ